ncbi:hypothetical protein KKC1_10530 [Calderihabitans maritimus]|uniref:Uncharacterized protein n=1 Tax=Calderihabitans maritimus TaxID=1246530 RepID=A0A1Z5HQT0_9FIRM|nr:hypothetical protein KKC1_10530 [Calderihabitans maritimus]
MEMTRKMILIKALKEKDDLVTLISQNQLFPDKPRASTVTGFFRDLV